MTDLVCGMKVDEKKAAFKSTYDGRSYLFDSESCKKEFDSDPQKYIKI